ncbi:MAG TPA: DUF2461 domain-containing protein [Ilumatobacter sp.]|nr:DUF2461 domain-containing protein [Ilumatobacter sp.]
MNGGNVSFTGIPPAALDFYARLEADNSKVFWEANKTVYRDVVKASVAALCDELTEYGPFHLFRPYNDVRFAKNRPPYKTQQGAYAESEGGAGFYFHISREGLMAAAGYYAMMRDQLERFREAVDATNTGEQIAGIVARLPKQYRIGAIDELKTAPKGYPKDHPRIDLLRRKGLMMSIDFGAPKWLHTKQAAAKVRDVWRAAEPMNAWLDAHVGPTTMDPEGRFG